MHPLSLTNVPNSTYAVAYNNLMRRGEYATDMVYRACKAVFLDKAGPLQATCVRTDKRELGSCCRGMACVCADEASFSARYFEQAFVCLEGFILVRGILERCSCAWISFICY